MSPRYGRIMDMLDAVAGELEAAREDDELEGLEVEHVRQLRRRLDEVSAEMESYIEAAGPGDDAVMPS